MARAPRIDTKRLDLGGLEAWIRAQLSSPALAAVLTVVLQVIRALFAQNTQLRARIQGRSAKPPSERLCALQRQLSLAFAVPGNDVQPDAPVAKPYTPERKTPRKRSGGRQSLPTHIAVVPVPNNVPAEHRLCRTCNVTMATMSHRCVSYYELIPGRVVLCKRYDETICCPHCDAIVSAKAPPSLLDGGLLGPALVTEALADKILDALPIERQARGYQRQGVPISASTLGRSVGSLLDLIKPLADRITARMKQSDYVQLDSTGLRVLDPSTPTGTWRETLWVLIGDRQWVSFAALHDGDAASIEEWMRGADAETFQCDGTSVTNFVEKKWRRCRPGCHAHARRKLVEAARRGDLHALDALAWYASLFKIEQRAARAGLTPEARQRLREVESAPLLERLRAWVTALAPEVEPKSPLGEALTYLQRQWMRLSLFLLDGNIELTNNRSERELRPVVLGQHTWLFAGDEMNAARLAAGFSVVQTALAHGANPRAYLHAIVAKLIAGHSHTRLDELLPDAMLRTNPEIADLLRRRPGTQVADFDDAHAA